MALERGSYQNKESAGILSYLKQFRTSWLIGGRGSSSTGQDNTTRQSEEIDEYIESFSDDEEEKDKNIAYEESDSSKSSGSDDDEFFDAVDDHE